MAEGPPFNENRESHEDDEEQFDERFLEEAGLRMPTPEEEEHDEDGEDGTPESKESNIIPFPGGPPQENVRGDSENNQQNSEEPKSSTIDYRQRQDGTWEPDPESQARYTGASPEDDVLRTAKKVGEKWTRKDQARFWAAQAFNLGRESADQEEEIRQKKESKFWKAVEILAEQEIPKPSEHESKAHEVIGGILGLIIMGSYPLKKGAEWLIGKDGMRTWNKYYKIGNEFWYKAFGIADDKPKQQKSGQEILQDVSTLLGVEAPANEPEGGADAGGDTGEGDDTERAA